MKNRHHVMFDVDGTLTESMDFDPDLFADAVEEELDTVVYRAWSQYANVTDSGILSEIIIPLDLIDEGPEIEKRVKRRFTRKIEEHLAHCPAREIHGASSFLERLISIEGVTLSIATGGWLETTRLKLQSAGLLYPEIAIASSSDHPARTEIMKISLERSPCRAGVPCTYFGDALWDKIACDDLGYNFVQVGSNDIHDQRIADFSDHDQALFFIGL